jgi:hypothetical protein
MSHTIAVFRMVSPGVWPLHALSTLANCSGVSTGTSAGSSRSLGMPVMGLVPPYSPAYQSQKFFSSWYRGLLARAFAVLVLEQQVLDHALLGDVRWLPPGLGGVPGQGQGGVAPVPLGVERVALRHEV